MRAADTHGLNMGGTWDAALLRAVPRGVTRLRIVRLGEEGRRLAHLDDALAWFAALEAFLREARLESLSISGALAGWGERVLAAVRAASAPPLRRLRLEGLRTTDDAVACAPIPAWLPALRRLETPGFAARGAFVPAVYPTCVR